MRYLFELYITSDEVTVTQWQQLHAAIVKHASAFERYDIVFCCVNNTVRYFLRCNKDISALASTIDGMLLRLVVPDQLSLPATKRKEPAIRLVQNSNLLDLKERYSIKLSKELAYALFRVQPIGMKASLTEIEMYFSSPTGLWTKARKVAALLPAGLLSAHFGVHTRYVKQSIPQYLGIAKSIHMLRSDSNGAMFKVDPFPYLAQDRYLPLAAYDFDKHSLIVGASGSGKSKLISLFVERLQEMVLSMNYRIVVVDPHASLASDFARITSHKIVTFGAEDGAELFPGAETDLTSAVELTATLFRSILSDQFNPRLDRLLRFSLFCLMTAQAMSLQSLKRFLTSTEYRNDILRHVEHYVPNNVSKFFGTDFNELRSQYYEVTIMPLVTMIDEMQLQPSLVGRNDVSLARLVQDNFLTVFSLNKVSMGEKTLKTVAGLLIQHVFLLAQSRVFGRKVILIIDEVSVVQNPTIAQILAEARKFNLIVILTQQYFGQVEKDLRDAIFANVYNYYMFKVSKEDALALEGNVSMDLPKELVHAERTKGLTQSQLKAKIMTELNPRECLVRVMSNGQIGPCILARTMDAPDTAPQTWSATTSTKNHLPEKYTEGQAAVKLVDKQAALPASNHSFSGLNNLLKLHSSSRINLNKKD